MPVQRNVLDVEISVEVGPTTPGVIEEGDRNGLWVVAELSA